MIEVVCYDKNGIRHIVSARAGDSLMESLVVAGIEGIDATCGGSCVCGTCQVYFEERWENNPGTPSPQEKDLIEASSHAQENSRLACQVRLSDKYNGLIIRLPPSQP
jgi:2Fe-2S ferredoxin